MDASAPQVTGPSRQDKLRLVLVVLGLVIVTVFLSLAPRLFPGNRALYAAIDANDSATVRQLLQAGADPNSHSAGWGTRRRSGRNFLNSPLIEAINHNSDEAALLLLNAGADPKATNTQGTPALILAVDAGRIAVVRELIRKGADVRAVSWKDGSSVLRAGGRWIDSYPKKLKPEMRALLEQAGAR
jgi:hypothetical protein